MIPSIDVLRSIGVLFLSLFALVFSSAFFFVPLALSSDASRSLRRARGKELRDQTQQEPEINKTPFNQTLDAHGHAARCRQGHDRRGPRARRARPRRPAPRQRRVDLQRWPGAEEGVPGCQGEKTSFFPFLFPFAPNQFIAQPRPRPPSKKKKKPSKHNNSPPASSARNPRPSPRTRP